VRSTSYSAKFVAAAESNLALATRVKLALATDAAELALATDAAEQRLLTAVAKLRWIA